jgi:small ligand-binding sensory domain FIST
MRWAAGVSGSADHERAITEVADEIRSRLGERTPTLAVVFVSSHHAEHYESISAGLRRALGCETLFGCSAEGVIGDGREVEQRPGLSVTAGALPGVRVTMHHHTVQTAPGDESASTAWEGALGSDASRARAILLASDPFTFPVEESLMKLDASFPATPKVGGIASGSSSPGRGALFADDQVHREGLVAAVLEGDVHVDAVVAQGCRPIGDPLFVTACSGNAIVRLNDKPVVEVLAELFSSLDTRDRELFRRSLHLGFAMRDTQTEFGLGDFLIRNILGVEGRSKSLLVGARPQETQVVQFHVRDAESSNDDLAASLEAYRAQLGTDRPAAALLFSCLGRGIHLYGHPDHDTDLFRSILGSVPLGGFFCNGEIGPVRGFTFLHGYTSSFAMIR